MIRMRIAMLCLTLITFAIPAFAQDLKFADTPFSQVVELYSRQTGKNVFLDETIQRNRKVTAHLPKMDIERAFEVVKSILGLQSYRVGQDGIVLFPPERANLYQMGMQTTIIKAPTGVETRWVTTLFNQVAPNVKVAALPEDNQSILLFGPEEQIRKIKEISRKFPDLAVEDRAFPMSLAEGGLAAKEIRVPGVEVKADPSGLTCKGIPEKVDLFEEKLHRWRRANGWGNAIFTPSYLTPQEVHRAAEASKGRATITDLGGTGSILIEGPMSDHLKLVSILQTLDMNAQPSHREIGIGEMKLETAKQAIRGTEVQIQGYGESRLVLVGKPGRVADAADVLETLARKKRQVLIQFKLAEITRGRLKNLGIELDKNPYTYGEIKAFSPNDVLPLLLQVLDEGKHGKILAQPNVRVVEGEKAKVTIGDRLPLEVAATAQTDAGSTLKLNTQLTWVDVGIKMMVEDVRINDDDSIRMALKTEVSSVIAYTAQGYPQIRTREAESILRVQDGSSVVLGGLLSREERKQRNKIPILSDLPVVGWLLNSHRKDTTQNEIIMIVTAKLAEE